MDGTRQRVLESSDIAEEITPTRKLDFANDSGAFNGSFVIQQGRENNITELIPSSSCESLSHHLTVTLIAHENRDKSRKSLRANSLSRTLPVVEGVVTPKHTQQQVLELDNGNKKEEQNFCSDSLLVINPPVLCSSGVMAEEEEEEQVLIGGDVKYPDAGNFITRGSEETFPPLERGGSTPCLFSTPDGHSYRVQQVSQVTTECALTLALKDVSPGPGANNIPLRQWNDHTQQMMETETGAGGNTSPERIDDKCRKNTLISVDSVEDTSCFSQMNALLEFGEWCDEKRKAASITSLVPETEKVNNNEVEEDAPFFQISKPACLHSVYKKANTTKPSRPHYIVGMRVEGRWGRRWFGAVVTEEEKNGYVQVSWDEDGSLMHLKVKEVRLPQGKDSIGSENPRKTLHTPSVLTVTQVEGLMDTLTPFQHVSVPDKQRVNTLEKDNWINPSILTLYVTRNARDYSKKTRFTLDKLVKRGAFVVSGSPLVLDNPPVKDVHELQRISFFVITEEDAKEDDGMITTVAHAMGVSVVSVGWLERLELDDAEERQRLSVPHAKELIGQGNDASLRWRRLSKNERFLSHKRVYLGEEDAEILFLLTVCGATVTRQQSSDEASLPHYVFVASGKRACIPPNATSVALIEKSWLICRIHEFFVALLPSRNDKIIGVAAGSLSSTSPTPVTKRLRQEKEEGETQRAAEVVRSPVPISGRWTDRVEVPAGGDAPEVLVGEDYYFRMTQLKSRMSEAPIVKLGRVMRLGNDGVVLMRLYEMKYTVMRQNPYTGLLENHTSVFLGPHTARVFLRDLIFSIPVYVVEAAQMRHVYTLESPPRDVGVTTGGGNNGSVVGAEEGQYQQSVGSGEIPTGLSSAPTLIDRYSQSYSGQSSVLNEILVNGWQIRPGVNVRFHDHLSSRNMEEVNAVQINVGRVQMIQQVANGQVLVVRKAQHTSDDEDSRLIVITPDMVVGIV